MAIEAVDPARLASAVAQLGDPDRMIRLQDTRDALQRATGLKWELDRSGISLPITFANEMPSAETSHKLGETLRNLRELAGLNSQHVESGIRIFDVERETASRIRQTLPSERFGNGPVLPLAGARAAPLPRSAKEGMGTVVSFAPRRPASPGATA